MCYEITSRPVKPVLAFLALVRLERHAEALEVMYNTARDWTFAEYRKQEFQALAVAALRRSTHVADTVSRAMDNWPEYDSSKDAIELDILRAALSAENYIDVADENGVITQQRRRERFVLPIG